MVGRNTGNEGQQGITKKKKNYCILKESNVNDKTKIQRR